MPETFQFNNAKVTQITSYNEVVQPSGETKITCLVDGKAVDQTLPIPQKPSILFYDKETNNFFVFPVEQQYSPMQFIKIIE